MGCHTWFYRKIERTQEEAKQSALNKLIRAKDLNWKIFLDRNYKGLDWSHFSDEELLHHNELCDRQIRMINKDLCQRAVWNRQEDETLTLYVDGKGLFIEVEYHDLFRIGGYPEDKLFSLEETRNFIKRNNIEDVYWDLLEKFWIEYPNGLIKFG